MVILLGLDECQLSELRLNLGNLSGNSSNEDRLQVCKERIRTRKYLGEIAVTTVLNALQQLSWPH